MQRLANETCDDYRKRLKIERSELKERLKGRVFHNNIKEGKHYTKSKREVKRQDKVTNAKKLILTKYKEKCKNAK